MCDEEIVPIIPSEEDIQELIELFNRQSSNVEEVQSAAEQQLVEYYNTNVIKLIVVSAYILEMDNIEEFAYYWAIFSLKKSFTPDVSLTRQLIRNVWNKNVHPDTRICVAKSVFRSLLNPLPSVCGLATVAYSNLFSIEETNMISMTENDLLAVFTDSDGQFSDLAKKTVISTIKEICKEEIIGELVKYEEIQVFLGNVNDFLYNILFCFDQYTIDILNEVCQSLKYLVHSATPLYFAPEMQQQFLNAFSNILEVCTDDVLYRNIHAIIYNMIVVLYDMPSFLIEDFMNISLIGVLQCKNPIFIIRSIEHWIDIANFEKNRRMKLNNMFKYKTYCKAKNFRSAQKSEDNFPIYLKFCSFSMKEPFFLSHRLIELLILPETASKEPESLESITFDNDSFELIPKYALKCLTYLFRLDPSQVFDDVTKFWTENNDDSLWTMINAKFLSIVAICNEPLVLPGVKGKENVPMRANQGYPGIPTFLNERVIQYTWAFTSSPNLRIVENALLSLRYAINEYSFLLGEETIGILLGWLGVLILNPNPTLCYLAIETLVSTINKLHHSLFEETIANNFQNLYGMFLKVIARDDAFSSNLFQEAFKLLKAFISKCSTLSSLDNIKFILKESCTNLSKSVQMFADFNQNKFISQQQNLSLIVECFLNFRENLADCFEIAVKTVLNFMDKHFEIHEDAFEALTLILYYLPENSNDLIEIMFAYVPVALETYNPSIISNTIFALSVLYEQIYYIGDDRCKKAQEFMESRIEDMYKLILDTLNNDQYFNIYHITYILRALSTLIKITSPQNEERDFFYELFTKYSALPINIQSDENDTDSGYSQEVNSYNLFYASLFDGFASLIPLYKNEERRNKIKLMRALMGHPKKFKYLEKFFFSSKSLLSFCSFLDTFRIVFGKDGTAFLNQQTNFELLLWALSLGDNKLNVTSLKLWKDIKIGS